MIQVAFPLTACFTVTKLLSHSLNYFQYFDFRIAVEVTRGRIWNPNQVRGVHLIFSAGLDPLRVTYSFQRRFKLSKPSSFFTNHQV